MKEKRDRASYERKPRNIDFDALGAAPNSDMKMMDAVEEILKGKEKGKEEREEADGE
jgi:hypothetical protein